MGRYDEAEPKLSPAILAAGIVVIIVAVVAWIYVGNGQDEQVVSELTLPSSEPAELSDQQILTDDETSEEEPLAESEPAQEISTEPLPPLEQSDELVRREVLALSPDFVGQVQTTELIPKYLQVINDFSQGQRLYKHISFLQPPKPFIAEQDGQGWYMTEKSYRRYDRLAKAFAELNVDKTIEAYRKLRPLLQQAYEEFGYPQQYQLEDLFKKAAAEMIAAPVVEGRVALIKPTLRYHFADKKLESLSPVQKQMLRMGPENTRIIQKKLRELVQELVRLQAE
ncbi:DUF3014 domain-containing protein [Methylomarinum vadi]|uniref:DUF3014 domain-containing protein n=1 Tax=Methylomarinum vadi TaxID=438855 RepID=UPI000565D826|nr:DUF3014 domain-containing protein [Methylomarinum vadi]